MKDEEEKQGELVAEHDQSVDLAALIPLGVQLIENSHTQAQEKIQIQKDTLEFNKEKMKVESSAFNLKYALIVFIAVSIVGISVGLIFWKNEVTTGLSVLSHVGAVVVGIIAGSGWERIRTKQ